MSTPAQVLNLPNLLTTIRIVLIPVFVTALIYNRFRIALYLFVTAALTDLFDGLLARLADQKTALGTFLDPLADKFLLVTSFILFAAKGWIPTWLAVAVISRDLIVVIGWFILYMITNNAAIEPVFSGKIAIALQLIVLAYVLLSLNVESLPPLPKPAFIATAAVTSLSALQYIYRALTVTHAA